MKTETKCYCERIEHHQHNPAICAGKSQHTPTPWSYDGSSGEPLIIEPQTGKKIVCINRYNAGTTTHERIENAAFIVKAVNCHEELISLLHDSANLIAMLKPAGANYPLVKRIMQAIAKAEGR